MNFLSKDYTVHLIDLLRLIVVCLGTGAAIFIFSDVGGWILVIAAMFIWVLTIYEIYGHFKLERKKK